VSIPSDTAATWSALQQLLGKALETPAADRLIWLERSTEVPDHLREPLRRLLEVQAGIDTRAFLATFPRDDADLTPATPPLIGDMIGPYRLLQELGDGGMGSVWLAERADGALKRKVALKLPRLAWVTDLAGRMSRERDILGSLEHPNIARLYDAGLDQHGRPFLALEYVEGHRLDRYCDDQRLSVEERVRLFLQVLDAVQHAHINLVLHRDLKPANILVNLRGEVRLLDFGIAKLVADERGSSDGALRSETLSRAMTPRFASPEQVQHQRLTLASDIYSLGVVLYEILIGASPLITTNGSRAEYEIAIVDSRLRTPSRARLSAELALQRRATPERVARSLRGDLDAVLMKAMAKTPADRYVSAEALRADLVRWLDGRPVAATPPSTLAALKKFVARNTMAVSLGTAAIAAIVATATIAVLQAREAQIESRRATAARDFILSLFDNANPELHGGRDISARELLLTADLSASGVLNNDSKIASDVYSAVSNLLARLGEKEAAGELLKMRVTLAERGKSEPMTISALLDYAEYLLQRNQVEELNEVIGKLSRLNAERQFVGAKKTSLLYFEGWSNAKSGNLARASERFDAALANSQHQNEPQDYLRALYGKIKVAVASGNRSEAIREVKKYSDYISSSGLKEQDKLYRNLELASALYSLGEYKAGLPVIDEIYRTSGKFFGQFRKSQRNIYIYWLNWRLQSGQIQEGLQWFASAKEITKGPGTIELDIELQILELEHQIAAKNYRYVSERIEEILKNNSEITIEQQRALSMARMKLNASLGKPDLILRDLEASEWRIKTDSELIDGWQVYLFWYRGVALAQQGRVAEALDAYKTAESIAAKNFGKHHPRRLQIAANRVFTTYIASREIGTKTLSLSTTFDLQEELKGLITSFHLVLPDQSNSFDKIRKCFSNNQAEKNKNILLKKIKSSDCVFI